MHAPLARHLTRFSHVAPPIASARSAMSLLAEPPREAPEPTLTMTVAALEARLASAREETRATLQAEHAAATAHAAAALDEALAMAAADRVQAEGEAIAAQIAAATQVLRDALSGLIARAIKPLLVEAVATRAVAALVAVLEQVLADPAHPALKVRGPAPLLAAVEAAIGSGGVVFDPADTAEISITANGLRIESRLAAALAAVDAEGV